MSKQTSTLSIVDNKYLGEVKISEMSVKGGNLPQSFAVKLDVTIIFDNVNPVKVAELACGGQSLRVMLQAKLRDETTATLTKYANEGLRVTFDWITATTGTRNMDPVKAANRALGAMSDEQKAEMLVMQFGFDRKVALQMVLSKKTKVEEVEEKEEKEEAAE